MSTTLSQYLVTIHFAPTGRSTHPHVKPPIIRPCPSVEYALKNLLLLPMDQFHPATARAVELDHFVEGVHILDLRNGHRLAWITNHTALTADGQVAVTLVFAPGAAPILPDGKPADLTKPDTITPQTIPLMLYRKEDNCLVPTPEYDGLYETTLFGCIQPEAVMEPGKYCTAFEGFRFDKAYVQGQGIMNPELQHYHFFETLAAAFSQLIAEPSINFDLTLATNSGAPAYFDKGLLSTISTAPTVIAEITLVPPPGLSQGTPLDLTGRFLHVFPPLTEPLISRTFQEQVARHIDFGHLQLDEWVLAGDLRLRPTHELQSLAANLGLHTPQAAHLTDYVCIKQHLFHQKEKDPAWNTHECHFHLHTDDFSVAFTELTNHTVNLHDPSQVVRYHYDSQVLSGAITNRAGDIIAELISQPPAPCQTPGLYLAIRQDFLDHPALLPLFVRQLLQNSPNWNVERGGMVYFQIGQYIEGELQSTLGYLKFQLLQKAIFLDGQLQRRPEIAAPLPLPNKEDPYELRLQWELRTPGQPVQQLVCQWSCANTAVALVEMFSLRAELFTGKAPSLAPFDLRLVTAEVLEGDQRHMVLKSQLSKTDPQKLAYFFNAEDASADLTRFIRSATAQDIQPAPFPEPAHRPRHIPPDPPASQHPSKGPSP